MNTAPYTFIFFGIAGSGKGTQVELLEAYLREKGLASDFVFASPGTEYRRIASSHSYTGEKIKELIEQGMLLPDFLTVSLVTSSIAEKITPDSCIIADGYPRTIPQSETLEQTLSFFGRPGAHVIYIEVDKEEAMKRMKLRARTDDTDDSIAKRFDIYVKEVLPSMEYFKNKDGYMIHTINGEQSIEDVHNSIITSLGL